MTTLTEKIVGDLGDKRRWRAYRARVKERARLVTAVEGAEAGDGRTRS